jgi:hypothetical protein
MTPRDSFAAHHGHLLGGALPREDLHLVEHVQGILDQGSAEQCVGAALAQGCQVQLSAEGMKPTLPSAGFIWWNSRLKHGDEELNVGTYIYTGVEVASELGLPPDADWPISEMSWNFAKRPASIAYTHAFDAKLDVKMYGVGQSRDEVRAAVGIGPVIFGTMVSRAFTELGPHSDPVKPPDGADIAGGHAMTIVGYDEWGVKVPQTWGTGVGNAGWYYLSWDYVLSDLTSEIVVVRYVPKIVTGGD